MTTDRSPDQSGLSAGAIEWITAFADDEHLIGARHAAWIGLGPFLEEDLAFCSIAQDELGHAIALYQLVTDDVDAFGLLRDPDSYRSCWLAELACESWDLALVRHWLYDRAEELRWSALADSSVGDLRALAARADREETFHRSHAELFLSRITTAETTGRVRVAAAVADLLPVAVGIFEPVAGEADALNDGIVTIDSATLARRWRENVQDDLARWGLDSPWPDSTPVQQGRTIRSDGFAAFQSYLQEVLVIDPSATW